MYTKLFNKKGILHVTPIDKIIGELLGNGEFSIQVSGRLAPSNPKGARQIPWIFINTNVRHKFCSIWNSVYCGKFKLIPTHCRFSCWKTVIKPRNILELFECHDALKSLDLPSKIGIDVRDYTYGAYAGFIYADSLEQGKEYYQLARDRIDKKIPIILKRGCTEMERLRPSNTWDNVSLEEIRLEERLNDLFQFNEINFYQGGWLIQEIKERWIMHSIKIGDKSAQKAAEKFSVDPDIWDNLVVTSITYHDKE